MIGCPVAEDLKWQVQRAGAGTKSQVTNVSDMTSTL